MVLEGVDKSGNLFGTVMYPHGEGVADLGLHLVQAGLAKVSLFGLLGLRAIRSAWVLGFR